MQRIHRQERPDEHKPQYRVKDVDGHAPHLLPQTLEAAVHGHVGIHNGDKRRENADIGSGLRAVIDRKAEAVGKDEHKRRASSGKAEAQAQQRARRAVYALPVSLHLCLGKLRDYKLRSRGHDAGREKDDRQHHALYDAVARERAVGRVPGGLQPARDKQVL